MPWCARALTSTCVFNGQARPAEHRISAVTCAGARARDQRILRWTGKTGYGVVRRGGLCGPAWCVAVCCDVTRCVCRTQGVLQGSVPRRVGATPLARLPIHPYQRALTRVLPLGRVETSRNPDVVNLLAPGNCAGRKSLVSKQRCLCVQGVRTCSASLVSFSTGLVLLQASVGQCLVPFPNLHCAAASLVHAPYPMPYNSASSNRTTSFMALDPSHPLPRPPAPPARVPVIPSPIPHSPVVSPSPPPAASH